MRHTKLKNTLMPKMTDYVALWEKYQREGVPQKIPIERFCVMNAY